MDMVSRLIGLCAAAGGVVTGFDLVLGEIRHSRAKFVILASDASERTSKQITDKCKYYNVKCLSGIYSGDELAGMIGKKSFCAAVAFVGKGPWQAVLDELGSV